MKYMEYLRSNAETIQKKVEELLEEFKAQPVGSGYIDIITSFEYIDGLMSGLTKIGIVIDGVTWWCHCSEENKSNFGCPHGLGGPQSAHFEGWFSEIGINNESYDFPESYYETLEHGTVTINEIKAFNEDAWNYIKEFSKSKDFTKCFYPALWLHVPEEWKRVQNLGLN